MRFIGSARWCNMLSMYRMGEGSIRREPPGHRNHVAVVMFGFPKLVSGTSLRREPTPHGARGSCYEPERVIGIL
eukprot:3156976-Pyramimonas_sp.AAC.1